MPDTDPSPGLWKRLSFLVLATLVPLTAHSQDLNPPPAAPNPAPAADQPAPASSPAPASAQTPAPATAPAAAPPTSQSALDRLTQSNRDLLDLLKKQQAVLEDMQFDRRLQSRQIDLLEARLADTLEQKADLEAKVAKLQAQLAAPPPAAPAAASSPATAPPATNAASASTPPQTPPPATYLPPPTPDGPPGTKSWHRIYTLSGTDNATSAPFHIEGSNWRVLWHNQDKDGDAYKNTSALFINAFAQGDTIPQKVCAKLGSGGDSTDLLGPGDFVLKIDASGGKWEFAVEDFR